MGRLFNFNSDAQTTDGPGLVLRASALLDIREFDFFVLAHNWWFGRGPDMSALERVFAAYMFKQIVPAWVRQYAREVMHLDQEDRAGRTRLGLHSLPDNAAPPRHGRLLVAITAAVFSLFYLAILESVSQPLTQGARDPAPLAQTAEAPATEVPALAGNGERPLSCSGGGPGLKFFEGLAFGLAGRTPPTC
jgi:hypothetical protein